MPLSMAGQQVILEVQETASWSMRDKSHASPSAAAPPSVHSSTMELVPVLLCVVLIGLYEHREAAGETLRLLGRCSKLSIAYTVLLLLGFWGCVYVSMDMDWTGDVNSSLIVVQSAFAMLFWLQEGIAARWTRECTISRGMMLLSALSIATKLYVNSGSTTITCTSLGCKDGDDYLSTGFPGILQGIELATLCLVLALLLVTFSGRIAHTANGGSIISVGFLVTVMGLLAIWVHPTLDDNYVRNIGWAFAMYLDSVTLLPQLEQLAAGNRFGVRSLNIAPICMYRVIGLFFWSSKLEELGSPAGFVLYTLQVCAAGFLALAFVVSMFLAKAEKSTEAAVSAADRRLLEDPTSPSMRAKEEPTLNQLF